MRNGVRRQFSLRTTAPHQFISVQRAFHQGLDLAVAGKDCGGLRSIGGQLDINQTVTRNIECKSGGDFPDQYCRPDQHRVNQASFGGFNSATQGTFVTRVNNSRWGRGQRIAFVEQRIMLIMVDQLDLGQILRIRMHFLRRCRYFGGT